MNEMQEVILKSLDVLYPENNNRYWVDSEGNVWSNVNGVMKKLKLYNYYFLVYNKISF